MGHGRNLGSFVSTDLKHLHHERDVVLLLKPFADGLLQHGWREWAEGLAAFYLFIKDGFHISPARIAEDRAVTERARSPFHAPLKPTDDFAAGNGLCGPSGEF